MDSRERPSRNGSGSVSGRQKRPGREGQGLPGVARLDLGKRRVSWIAEEHDPAPPVSVSLARVLGVVPRGPRPHSPSYPREVPSGLLSSPPKGGGVRRGDSNGSGSPHPRRFEEIRGDLEPLSRMVPVSSVRGGDLSGVSGRISFRGPRAPGSPRRVAPRVSIGFLRPCRRSGLGHPA